MLVFPFQCQESSKQRQQAVTRAGGIKRNESFERVEVKLPRLLFTH